MGGLLRHRCHDLLEVSPSKFRIAARGYTTYSVWFPSQNEARISTRHQNPAFVFYVVSYAVCENSGH
jgi:hypothetical protein